MRYYSLPTNKVLEEVDSSRHGLDASRAESRLERWGRNTLPSKPPRTVLHILLEQLKSPLIYILIIAFVITLFLQEYSDAIVIFLAVFVNTILGFVQEYKAQKEFQHLKNLVTPQARVLRNGREQEIDAAMLVPGDILVLKAGMKVGADARLIDVRSLLVNEAVLTGESSGVEKISNQLSISQGAEIQLAEQENMVFMGTSVLSGNGVAVVVSTGMDTELGKIATMLKETEEERTPLQKKLGELSIHLAILVAGISMLVLILGLISGHSFVEMFTMAVALAVAAIPEGLAVALTAILAIGMQRILKRKALVRKLVAAETLGSTTVICTDKTGTLTEGVMRVTETAFIDREKALEAMILNNNLENQTEVSLCDYARQESSRSSEDIKWEFPRLDELPFTSENKFMLTLHKHRESNLLLLKGAPEKVIQACDFSDGTNSEHWQKQVEEFASRGLRVLALASKRVDATTSAIPSALSLRGSDNDRSNLNDTQPVARADGGIDPERSEGSNEIATDSSSLRNDVDVGGGLSGYKLLGIVGIEDPPRKNVKEALVSTADAGIKVIVVTGDNLVTAKAVMRKLGIQVKSDEVVEGSELSKMSEEDIRERLSTVKLFARVTPTHKLLIVKALQSKGEVVAMTGDGVNDAPALKKADIGIVVDGATDVSKEIADMVLLDSNFKTIVAAVEEGRGIFDNMRKVILYLLSDSFSEIFLITGTLLLRLPLPLLAAQILWINLITDGFPNLALTVDPKEKGIMKKPPRSPKVSFLDTEIKLLIFMISFVTSVTSFIIFMYYWGSTGDIDFARSVVFATLGIDSLIYVFSVRSLKTPIFKDDLLDNWWLLVAVFGGILLQLAAFYVTPIRNLLKLEVLGIEEWVVVVSAALLVIVLVEVTKWVFLHRGLKSFVKR